MNLTVYNLTSFQDRKIFIFHFQLQLTTATSLFYSEFSIVSKKIISSLEGNKKAQDIALQKVQELRAWILQDEKDFRKIPELS